MKELRTEITINSSRQRVWDVLTDFSQFPEWNPFIIRARGDLSEGNMLSITITNRGKETSFEPKVTKVEDKKCFEWLGSALLGTFKGRHFFILEDLPNGQTRLIHGEHFSGLLSGLILLLIGKDTEAGFEKMNQALKEVVEDSNILTPS